MVEMSLLSGASMTPCGWVGPVVGGEDLNGVSQHTLSCGHFSAEMLSIGISYVVIASICSEKTRLKKWCVPTLYREWALSDMKE